MSLIVEPFFTCLLASMIWAPIVFLTASRIHDKERAIFADKIWPAALFAAALPALLAPVAAVFGMSLRAHPPIPPMADIPVADYTPALAAVPAAAAQPGMDMAAVLQAGAALYVYGFLLFMALGVARLVGFSYRARYAIAIDEPRLEAGLDVWRRRMGLRRRPRYAFTDAVSSVCVHGFFRPVILMPMNLLDRVSVDDAVLMGAHEMAHIRRGDTWLFAFTKIVKAIFWFNPFIHRISARSHLAAEQAADALVIARGVDRRQYAKCFVEGLRFASGLQPNEHALVPSFTPFDKRSRRERLDAILSRNEAAPMLGLPGKIGLVLSVAAAGGLAFAQAAFAVAPKPPAEALPQIPVEGEITFGYGEKDAKLGPDRPIHEGVDIKAARGTPVRAAGDGKVIDASGRYKGSKAWGNVVVIDHGHGLVTRYAHLDSFNVRKGDAVKAGDAIGVVGSTGVVSGPHLHFEVINEGLNIDPTPVVAADPTPAPKPVPVMKPRRAAVVAPASAIEIAPDPVITPDPSVSVRSAESLKGRHKDLNARLTELFHDLEEDFEGFEGFTFELDEDFDGFEGFTVDIGDFDVEAFADAHEFAVNAFDHVRGVEFLSEEDREKIREAQREAQEKTREARRKAERTMRDHEERRAELAERRAEQAERRAQEAAERAERAHERAMERAEREAERAMEQAERAEEWELNRREMLELHEKALREAKADLEREIAKVERERAELNRRQKNKDKTVK